MKTKKGGSKRHINDWHDRSEAEMDGYDDPRVGYGRSHKESMSIKSCDFEFRGLARAQSRQKLGLQRYR